MEALFATIILIAAVGWAFRLVSPNMRPSLRWLRFVNQRLLINPLRASYNVLKFIIRRLFGTPDYHFHQSFLDNYPVSTLEFFDAVEAAFTDRQVAGAEISRVTRREWHFLSDNRIYLLIQYRQAACVIGGLSIGTGFQVAWRYAVLPNRLLTVLFDIPFIGQISERLIAPPTFYRNDLYMAFEQLVRASITDATELLARQGIRPLNEDEQSQLLREFYEN